MSAFSEQLAATLGVLGEQVPDCVVECTRQYLDATGTTITEVFSALRGGVSARGAFAFDGIVPNDAFVLHVRWAELVADGTISERSFQRDETIEVRRGSEPSDKMVVVEPRMDPTRTVLEITVRKAYQD